MVGFEQKSGKPARWWGRAIAQPNADRHALVAIPNNAPFGRPVMSTGEITGIAGAMKPGTGKRSFGLERRSADVV
jgi:hypothetical protein